MLGLRRVTFSLFLCFALISSLECYVVVENVQGYSKITEDVQINGELDVPVDFVEVSENLQRFKREEKPEKSYTKVVLESVRDGTGIFAASNGAITAAIPNPVTAIAAGVTGVIAAVTGVIAANIK